ncbi:MAG: DNA cytosine methyltransferase [Oscillatoriales cyanobacterium]|uniref:DNA cytosine methyltransferase n=1 Tax=unclassified Microcoleus TaxID=2642155 RepID=UPI001D7C7898|nr:MULTISPECIES: DNA cytosine methyltransferase [unclassified Microcoleus]MCC3459797.1 DNA cytosine methyltransferase [Microcoleus sp. PH2017_11_PCY_U_A]MCC3478230.1 DNA cytosine methyltransferase [Microcoleus sp. PH2017_12_PCY_D_A]TAF00865.1 MAG: DNA cytosine methyltransferase [Oscillatoriales cyanobacterium]TAF39697.1 MAG: DNA cytosine methyltransferase [Oscillatoriales cyanobacterium]
MLQLKELFHSNMQLKCIDFFAGIGAWELASNYANLICSQVQFRTIEFIEINPQAQKVLRSHFPEIPIYPDIRSYNAIPHKADVHFISFPCTGTSAAGTKTGLAHFESNLWFEALRCIVIGRPTFVVIENPAGVIDRGLRAVVAGLSLAGYEVEIEIVSASELGAPHERQRVFVIAYADNLALQQRKGWICWSESLGTDIETARKIGARSEIKPSFMSVDARIPSYLAGVHYENWWRMNPPPVNPGLKRRTPGRREAINLVGRSIVPLQAFVALMRVQFLANLIE